MSLDWLEHRNVMSEFMGLVPTSMNLAPHKIWFSARGCVVEREYGVATFGSAGR